MSTLPHDPHLAHKYATSGNEYAGKRQFQEAVHCYTKAIELNPDDYRFYSNRAFCLAQLGHYDRSLQDAVKATSLKPDNARAWFRRGIALKGLVRYRDAECAFLTVMRLNDDCDVAQCEIKQCRESLYHWERLCSRGVSENEWRDALYKGGFPSVAAELLEQILAKREMENMETLPSRISSMTLKPKHSELQNAPSTALSKVSQMAPPMVQPVMAVKPVCYRIPDDPEMKVTPAVKIHSGDPLTDASNPLKCSTLWIGNLNPQIKKSALRHEFEKYGRIKGEVALQLEKKCAFINYEDNNYKAAGEAMRNLQGKEMCGSYLFVKFPDRALMGPHAGAIVLRKTNADGTKPYEKRQPAVNGVMPNGECYYWRTTGCAYGNKCRHIHIRENKEIDQKPWMKGQRQSP